MIENVANFFRFGSNGYTSIEERNGPVHPYEPTEYRVSGDWNQGDTITFVFYSTPGALSNANPNFLLF